MIGNLKKTLLDMIISKRLKVEKWEEMDLKFVLEHYSNKQVLQYMKECEISTLEEAKDFIEKNNQNYQDLNFSLLKVVHRDERVTIGSAGCWKIIVDELGNRISDSEQGNEEVEIGYDFNPKYWGKGFATEVTLEWIKYMKNFRILKLVAFCDYGNIPSHKVLQKTGFKRKEGLFKYLNQEVCIKFEFYY